MNAGLGFHAISEYIPSVEQGIVSGEVADVLGLLVDVEQVERTGFVVDVAVDRVFGIGTCVCADVVSVLVSLLYELQTVDLKLIMLTAV